MRAGSAVALGLVLLSGCARVPEDAVAVWDEDHVTAAELEARILELPPGERRPEDGDFAVWYQQLARELAMERILAAEARLEGLAEDPATQRAIDELVDEALAVAFLERRLPPPSPVTEEDVQALYEERKATMARPAQRMVLHLFKRRDPGMESQQIRGDLLALRRRILDGESFTLLARQHSQSETRHRDGVMGVFRRGQLDPKLERLLFDLPVKVPSEPVMTPQGGHLFWVEMAIEERNFELVDVQRSLAEEIRRDRRNAAIDALTPDYQLPAGSYLPEARDLWVLSRSGDPQALVMRVGDFELRFGELTERLQAATEGGDPWQERARRLVAWLERRERLVEAARGEGFDQQPELAARLERLRRAELAGRLARQRMLAEVGRREEALRAAYENNRSRYSEPLRLRLDRLRVPIGDPRETLRRMARLEGAVDELSAGELELAALAAELGGSVEPMAWMTFEQLRAQLPRVAELVAPLAEGGVTPPFRSVEDLEILSVRERREPAPLPFEAARAAVAEDYLEQHGQEVYRQMSDEMLRARSYRPLVDRLSALAPGPDKNAKI